MRLAARPSTAIAALSLLAASQASAAETTYTLYRNSPLNGAMRIHVATFDAAEGGNYNRDNCATAADLFQRQAGVSARFWCEAGRFKK